MKRIFCCMIAAVLAAFMTLYFTGCVDNSNKNPIITIEIDPEKNEPRNPHCVASYC